MATVINAADAVIKVNNVVVGCAQSAEFTVSRKMDDATCASSDGWAQSSPGQKSWSGSFGAVMREFVTADGAQVTFDMLFDLLDDGTLVTVEYTRKDNSVRYVGSAYVGEVKYTQPADGIVTWTASYTGHGPIARMV